MGNSGRAAWKPVLVTSVVVAAGLFIGKLIASTLPAVQIRMAALSSGRAIGEYIRTHSVRKLQIGAGRVDYPGWLNTDIEPGPGEIYLAPEFPSRNDDSEYGNEVLRASVPL